MFGNLLCNQMRKFTAPNPEQAERHHQDDGHRQ